MAIELITETAVHFQNLSRTKGDAKGRRECSRVVDEF
jgi:hypothetical protein